MYEAGVKTPGPQRNSEIKINKSIKKKKKAVTTKSTTTKKTKAATQLPPARYDGGGPCGLQMDEA